MVVRLFNWSVIPASQVSWVKSLRICPMPLPSVYTLATIVCLLSTAVHGRWGTLLPTLLSNSERIGPSVTNHTENRSDENRPQILCFFHFPPLNRTALTTAMELSAIAIAANAPFDCMRCGIASQYASGISNNQNPKKLTMVG